MRRKVPSAAVSLLVFLPSLSYALGLGDIQLKSPLNAPLNAEIELIGASAEELGSLRVQMASRELFSRYGLEYPAFVSGIQLRTVRNADGRDVIQLTSTTPMTEPFATLLVEANVARQRIVREYTVLFDPPVFAPAPAAGAGPAAPVAAPVTGGGERSGDIDRPAAPAPTAPPVADVADGSYVVQRGDSLSRITQRVADGSNRAMIAIYQANPSAFDGNINELRSGAVLRLPDSAAINAIDPGEATREVRRQSASWSSERGITATGTADPRLRLVPPAGAGEATGASDSTEVRDLRDRVSQLESELADSRRLLELRNAELARLQTQGQAAVVAPGDELELPASPEAEAPAAEEPADEPQVAEPPAAEQPRVATPAVAQPESGPGLIDRLKAFWFIPVGLILLALGFLGVRAARRRRENEFDAGLGAFGAGAVVGRESSSNTLPLRKPVVEPTAGTFVVEESGTHERPSFAPRTPQKVDIDETGTTGSMPKLDATAALEQGDPLAEADFHMAYGLYDQAADLVRLAIEREPQRRDLKLKLLEVFFVWGNRDQFLQTARELAESRAQAEPGEWEKVIIMGKQLAPEDALFSQATAGMGHGGVDLNLEGGQNRIDFDLHGEPSVALTTDGGVDLDLSSVLGDPDPTGNSVGLDFSLDDPQRGADPALTATTRQMIQPGFGEEAATLRFQGPEGVEGPTIEQPQLDSGQTLRHKLDAQVHFGAPDQTAELALDDLGLDLGSLESTGSNLLDDSRLTRALETPDAPTLIAGLGDTSRQLLNNEITGSPLTEIMPLGDATSPGENQLTELMPLGEFDGASHQPTEMLPLDRALGDVAATSRLTTLDFELGEALSEDATGTQPALTTTDFGLDLDVGAPEQGAGGEYVQTQRITPTDVAGLDDSPAQDMEPITMSEVGTKLDLARAYMDMGDPDGARSILNEVLQEGSSSQKQEAQRLIDSIPG